MMTDQEIDNIYKANLPVSHYAALRGVWDAGYNTALNINVTTTTPDQTTIQTNPVDTPVNVSTV